MQQILDEIGKQIGLAAAALTLIGVLLKSYFSAKKLTVDEKPTEVAVVGSAFNPGDMKEALATLIAIKSDLHAIANMLMAREKREAEEEREERIRADERERIERERREEEDLYRRGRKRPD